MRVAADLPKLSLLSNGGLLNFVNVLFSIS